MNSKVEVNRRFSGSFELLKYLYAYCVLRPFLSHSLSAVLWICNQTSPIFFRFDKIWFSVKLFGIADYSMDRVFVYLWRSTIIRNTGTRQLCNLHACSQVFATAYEKIDTTLQVNDSETWSTFYSQWKVVFQQMCVQFGGCKIHCVWHTNPWMKKDYFFLVW